MITGRVFGLPVTGTFLYRRPRSSAFGKLAARGGKRYAVGVAFSALELSGWSLIPVLYKKADQQRVLAEVYDRIQTAAASFCDTYQSPSTAHEIETVAGDLLADTTCLVAPCFKDASFADEEEWRLFRPRIEGKNVSSEHSFPLKFRLIRELVAPYAEFVVKPDAFRKVIMGYQVAEHPSRQSLRLLLQESGIDLAKCEIERSDVPARGST